jgi:hypothetical protein
MDGLKKGRTVYVRKPGMSEKNDNNCLIHQGAVAVDLNGKVLSQQVVGLPSLFD